MFEFISKWLEKKIVEWLAKQIGVSPQWLQGVLGDLIAFIKEIIGAIGQNDAKLYFRSVAHKLRAADTVKARYILKKVEGDL